MSIAKNKITGEKLEMKTFVFRTSYNVRQEAEWIRAAKQKSIEKMSEVMVKKNKLVIQTAGLSFKLNGSQTSLFSQADIQILSTF